jgi:hypothetical protein
LWLWFFSFSPYGSINFALYISKTIDELMEFMTVTSSKHIFPFINLKHPCCLLYCFFVFFFTLASLVLFFSCSFFLSYFLKIICLILLLTYHFDHFDLGIAHENIKTELKIVESRLLLEKPNPLTVMLLFTCLDLTLYFLFLFSVEFYVGFITFIWFYYFLFKKFIYCCAG